jgi:hypothetical protein
MLYGKVSKISITLLYLLFFLIWYHTPSVEFYEIVVSLNQNLYSRFFYLCIVFQ